MWKIRKHLQRETEGRINRSVVCRVRGNIPWRRLSSGVVLLHHLASFNFVISTNINCLSSCLWSTGLFFSNFTSRLLSSRDVSRLHALLPVASSQLALVQGGLEEVAIDWRSCPWQKSTRWLSCRSCWRVFCRRVFCRRVFCQRVFCRLINCSFKVSCLVALKGRIRGRDY